MKKTDVLIEYRSCTDPRTGVEIPYDMSFTVWADKGHKNNILSVDGVTDVYNTLGLTEYSVYIDKRYNLQEVAKEVEASILCNEPEVK